ncbi:nucleoside-diphosphate sugar epimerase/dehydratase [Marinomonas pollencensis]|uniref:Uncharacterized protein n=1 Tax=Marinomonas pollencensis TaxID=491954 RepID=A0A3E0DPG6_9GAMM|nr:hypothetical protein [Marinomonas pollencensis]REG84142.1 hypothetical protein DFP81_10421 [Marinomonas pollencensis]
MKSIKRWVTDLMQHQHTRHRIILIGIDYPSFSFSKYLQEEAKDIQIMAFIDEEPWTNKTQLHGVTVYYPSDLMTLIDKHQVELVVTIEGQLPELSAPLKDKVITSNAQLVALSDHTSNEQQLAILRQALAQHTH